MIIITSGTQENSHTYPAASIIRPATEMFGARGPSALNMFEYNRIMAHSFAAGQRYAFLRVKYTTWEEFCNEKQQEAPSFVF